MKVLFFGTSEFAVPVLRALSEEGHEIVAVVTQPDRPAGRGRQRQSSPVKKAAEAEGIPVLQPGTPRGPEFLEAIRAREPGVSVVAAYGEILPGEVLDVARHGSLNVHASLLPELRGAAPVPWAIIRGCTRTGVTIMRMVERLDAGPILYQVPVEMGPDATAGELGEQLAELGASALIEGLSLLEAGKLREVPQDESRATYAPKLSPEIARLDWAKPAEELARWIRGCDPVPGAWTELDGARVKLFRPEALSGVTQAAIDAAPGAVVEADPVGGLIAATGRGLLRSREVQPEGRRRMESAAWIRGRGVRVGDRFR
ncbi:MAG: methionyl-tRNA formyltransferase [Gemmatimonadetes bacterium]|nr:methionyl-tRNA formyltransferase [Gemmatimonadota bacterium]